MTPDTYIIVKPLYSSKPIVKSVKWVITHMNDCLILTYNGGTFEYNKIKKISRITLTTLVYLSFIGNLYRLPSNCKLLTDTGFKLANKLTGSLIMTAYGFIELSTSYVVFNPDIIMYQIESKSNTLILSNGSIVKFDPSFNST